MLDAPRPGDDLVAAAAYWCPLVHLLVYSLGWDRPDIGLRWWYDARKPTDDPRLRLIADVWGADGQLDWFAAWLWTDGAAAGVGRLAVDDASDSKGGTPVDVDRRWINDQRRAAEAWGGHSPLTGGSDPLHLSSHWQGPMRESPSPSLLLRSHPTERRAALVLDSMVGWYRELHRQMQELPSITGRSWHVDVFVKPVGWLGTYRRSLETGRCFAGRHRFHSVGS